MNCSYPKEGLVLAMVMLLCAFTATAQTNAQPIAHTPSEIITLDTFSGNNPRGSALAVGDLNNDGFKDVVVVYDNYEIPHVFLQDTSSIDEEDPSALKFVEKDQPDLKFVAKSDQMTFYSVDIGDINADGKQDVVWCYSYTKNKQVKGAVDVLYGNGDGTLDWKKRIIVDSPRDVKLGSFNPMEDALVYGEDYLDLFVVNYQQKNQFYLNSKNGPNYTFLEGDEIESHTLYPVNKDKSVDADLGHFNDDGYIDVVVANLSGYTQILLSNGDGTFEEPDGVHNILNACPDSRGVTCIDSKDDGIVDMVFVSTYNSHNVLFYDIKLTPASSSSYIMGLGSTPCRGTDAGDITGDGFPEIVVCTWTKDHTHFDWVFTNDIPSEPFYQKTLSLYLETAATTPSPAPSADVIIEDMDGDQQPEVIMAKHFNKDSVPSTYGDPKPAGFQVYKIK